ncbi:MAG: glycosyltransferase family 2 protein [Lachnospiraceae bacterium]|nr:glycosyltransferase family 2 protein [Lachnospiraceae bacterium]
MISVIVPVYKVEKYLRRCVDSILAQTFPDFELLLIDDGSPDGCPQICDEYAGRDPRVRVIHKPNGGLISARNEGIRAAGGEYVCIVDGDDWACENMLQFIHDTVEHSPVPLDMVLFAAHNVYEDHLEETVNEVPEGFYDRERLEKEIFPYLLIDSRSGLQGGVIQAHTWDKAFKRELLAQHYTREERIRVFTDVPMTYECLLYSRNVHICNEHLYMYNKTNEGSIRAKSRENLLTESFRYLIMYMREHLGGLGPSTDRQLNQYAAMLIIRTGKWRARTDPSLLVAARHMKEGLRESDMLSFVSVKGLPRKVGAVILLFKMRLYVPAMLLCAARVRQEKSR